MKQDRQSEAREKIILGALIINAGLRDADRAFLLGALIEAGKIVAGGPEHDRLRTVGEQAFRAKAQRTS